ncbi:MAG: GntR family transcriptional regulator [Burkholderiaceae bacterium]
MKVLGIQPSLVEQVHDAILFEVAAGKLAPGDRIIQEQIAKELGVSRQPVQQALLLLHKQGVLRDAPGRGLQVAPLDLNYVKKMYDMRAVIEGLAFREAALNNAARAKREGPALLRAGRQAIANGSVGDLIAADMAFHEFVYELAENPLIAPAMDTHWIQAQRVMGEVLMRDDQPRNIWDQHEALLQHIIAGDEAAAEKSARQHILQAAAFMIARLNEQVEAGQVSDTP